MPQETVDPFIFFKKATAEIFGFLVTDFAYNHVKTFEQIPDCAVEYHNATTGIRVYYELNSQVSVDLIKLRRTVTDVIEEKSYDLLLLMEARHSQTDPHEFFGGDKKWTNEYVEKLLVRYAEFLKKEARDVLTGDFSVFPALKELAAKHRRRSNKELFGTYTGESPRFATRPTLEEVFAGARDQDKTFRIYEAYWDHQFSKAEIADFLSVTQSAIDQALSDFDDQQ